MNVSDSLVPSHLHSTLHPPTSLFAVTTDLLIEYSSTSNSMCMEVQLGLGKGENWVYTVLELGAKAGD